MSHRRLVFIGSASILIVLAGFYGLPMFLSARAPVIIGDGDSIMANGVALHFLKEKVDGGIETVDIAVPGNRVVVEVLARGLHGAPTLKFAGARQVVWLIGGTNDLAQADVTEGELLDNVELYFRQVNAKGYRPEDCFYTDILPRKGISDQNFEIKRMRFNTLIAKCLEGLATVIPSGEDPELQDPSDPAWFTDGTHLTARGSQKLADDAFYAIQGR
jgi:lysophospholipase L1-like esterase